MITKYQDLPLDKELTFIVEANHMFKASTKHNRMIYMIDVIKYLERVWFKRRSGQYGTIYGTPDESQFLDFKKAMDVSGVDIFRMMPKKAPDGETSFFQTEETLDQVLDKAKEVGLKKLCLVGFHHRKFVPVIEKWANSFEINSAAFVTQSTSGGLVSLPRELKERNLVRGRFALDNHLENILKENRIQSRLKAGA